MPLADPTRTPGAGVELRLADADPAVRQALDHGLALPVAALRAAMETLWHEFPRDARIPPGVHGALQEVELLGRNVAALLELAAPPEPRPLRCSLEEVLRSAWRPLPHAWTNRLIVARPNDAGSFEVDGPLLSRALSRLLENAFEAGAEEVLLAADIEGDEVRFSVVDHARESFEPEEAFEPFRSWRPARLGLGLPLARRAVEALDGTLELAHVPGRETCACVRVPRCRAREAFPEELAA